MSLSATSTCLLNTSRDGDSTTSLGSSSINLSHVLLHRCKLSYLQCLSVRCSTDLQRTVQRTPYLYLFGTLSSYLHLMLAMVVRNWPNFMPKATSPASLLPGELNHLTSPFLPCAHIKVYFTPFIHKKGRHILHTRNVVLFSVSSFLQLKWIFQTGFRLLR